MNFAIPIRATLVSVSLLSAQHLSPLPGGANQDLHALFFVDSLTAFAAGNEGVLLKSTIGGADWSSLSSNTTQNLNGLGFANATGYAVGTSGTILKTTNGGDAWTAQSSGTTQSLNALWLTDANTGYAVGAGGTILKTTNGGDAWTAQSSGTSQNLNAVRFTGPSTGYAAGVAGTLLKTTNAGATWEVLNSGVFVILRGIAFTHPDTGYVAGNSGTLLKTTNAGASWSALSSGTTQPLHSISFSAGTGYTVGGNGLILATANSGGTWTTVADTGKRELFSVAARTAGRLFVAGAGGSLRGTIPPYGLRYPSDTLAYTAGITAASAIPTLASGVPASYSAAPALPAGLVIDPISGAISGRPEGPSTTSHLITAANEYGAAQKTVSIRVTAPPPPSNLVYSQDTGIYTITPSGGSPEQIPPNIPSFTGQVAHFSINPSLPTGLLFDTVTGIISGIPSQVSSANYTVTAYNAGGFTIKVIRILVNPPAPWRVVYSITTPRRFITMRFSPSGRGLVLGTGSMGCTSVPCAQTNTFSSVSENYGNSWQPVLSDVGYGGHGSYTLANAAFADTDLAYASVLNETESPYLKQLSWDPITRIWNAQSIVVPPGYQYSQTYTGIYFRNNSEGFLATPSTLFRYSSGTWTTAIDPSSSDAKFLGMPRFLDATEGVLSSRINGNIFKTTDAGTTWSEKSSGVAGILKNFLFVNAATGFATAEPGKIYKTTDGALSWTAYNSGTSQALSSIFFLDANNGYAVGAQGAAVKTTNGGSTWFSISTPVQDSLIEVVFTDANTGYALSGNRILKFDPTYVGLSQSPRKASLQTLLQHGKFSYVLPTALPVRTRLLDLKGREIWGFDAGLQQPGEHTLWLPLEKLDHALYILDFRAGRFRESHRLIKP